MDCAVITKTMVRNESARRVRMQALRMGEELRRLRMDAGLSLRELGAATGLHPSYLQRIETSAVQPSLENLTIIGVALGADLSVRFFPGSGPRLHDRFQAPMIEAILRVLDRRWGPTLEVPVTHPSRGVIDLVLDAIPTPLSVVGEAQSEFRRLEQQLRWSAEKADGLADRHRRDGREARAISRLLILRATAPNREIARRFEASLRAAYPARSSEVVAALTTADAPWPGAGIVWVRVEAGKGTMLSGPPRGVPLGR